MFHRHDPVPTGLRIVAVWGKPNLPEKETPVHSSGELAVCSCREQFIIHDPRLGFPWAYTALEKLERLPIKI